MGLLRKVLAEATEALRYEDAFERLRALDGVGIPLRTLKEPPFSELLSRQTPRHGGRAELAGLPWVLTRLTPDRLEERAEQVATRLRAMRIDFAAADVDASTTTTRRASVERVRDMEQALVDHAAEHGLAIALRMKALLVERREHCRLQRERAISVAYRELRPPSRSGPTD